MKIEDIKEKQIIIIGTLSGTIEGYVARVYDTSLELFSVTDNTSDKEKHLRQMYVQKKDIKLVDLIKSY